MKRTVLTALVSVFLLTACIPGVTQPAVSPSPETVMEESVDASPETTNGDAMMEEVIVIPVQGNDFTFDVEEIRVKQGDKVKVAFTNTEGFHDFVIDELNVNTGMVPMGQTVEVEIPTDQPGEYAFYCSVGNHRQQGMEGTLIIE